MAQIATESPHPATSGAQTARLLKQRKLSSTSGMSDDTVIAVADRLVTNPPAACPTKLPALPAAFEPYKNSLARTTIYRTMAPLMWLAKGVLNTLLRAMGGKLHMICTVDTRVAVWELKGRQAEGPVVVLMHGLGGSSAEYFPLLSRLRTHCSRVVAVDLPGHGNSPALGRGVPARFVEVQEASERMCVAVTQAVNAHLGATPAHFIGHSLGGFVAAQVVLDRSRRGMASKVLLTETDGAPWSAARLAADRHDFAVPDAASARRVARGNYPMRPVLGWLYTPFLWARLASPEIQYLTHSDLKQPILAPEALAQLPPDTMLIAGRHDKFGTEDDVAYLVDHLPADARVRRPDTGHGDIADAHPEICAIVEEFLRAK